MKNKLILGLIAASVITGSLFADKLESMEGLTTSRIICESGVEGFVLSIVRENTEDAVLYESCSSDGIDVERKELVETRLEQLDYVIPRLPGDFVTLGGTEYYFPNGYTEPTVAANNTCVGGFYNTPGSIDCGGKHTGSMTDNYLNLTEVGGDFMHSAANVDSVEGLANLTRVGGELSFYDNQISSLHGLENLTYVGGTINFRKNAELTDISALNNLSYIGEQIIFNNIIDYSVKLDADSYICQNYDTKVSSLVGPKIKSHICYE